jgi:hypothetical protein
MGKRKGPIAPRSPRSPRVKMMRRRMIQSKSYFMRKADPLCKHQDVFTALVAENPNIWKWKDRPTVERWAFRDSLKDQNRGTPTKDPELRKAVLERNTDPDVPDTEKSTRKMAKHFTTKGESVSRNHIHKIYVEDDLYPARPTKELNLSQHHHRRLRVHFARKHRRMSEEDWESWISSDETIIHMRKTINPKNDVKWVKKGTKRPNPKPSAKHVPSLLAWGAIGGKGQKSKLHIFRTTMTAAYYKDTIIKKYALPFYRKIKETYPDAVFWQDNDPKHTPNEDWIRTKFDRFTAKPPPPCRENIQRTGKRGRPKSDPCEVCVCALPTYEYHSANSADLPSIENTWALLDAKIWEDPNTCITSLPQLEKAAQKAWKSITSAEILKIQHSMPKRMKAVIESEGWPIDY